MAEQSSIREQIEALPTSAGADGRDLVDRQAVLRIIAALDTSRPETGAGPDALAEREACAAICDDRARFYGLKVVTKPRDPDHVARMRHSSMALEIAADMIRSRPGGPPATPKTRVLFGRELNDDHSSEQGK